MENCTNCGTELRKINGNYFCPNCGLSSSSTESEIKDPSELSYIG